MSLFAASIPSMLYSIYVYAIPLIILAALFGFRWKVGMWGNCVTLGCVLFSALVAVGWWEDAAVLLAKQAPAMSFIADCLAFWVIFIVSLLILDTATRSMSTVKVKYNDTVEKVGNGVALLFLFLAVFSVHIFANGHMGMVGEGSKNTVWPEPPISIIRLLSAGNLKTFTQGNQFDDRGDFLQKHLQRRQSLMNHAEGNDGAWQKIQYPGAQAPNRRGG